MFLLGNRLLLLRNTCSCLKETSVMYYRHTATKIFAVLSNGSVSLTLNHDTTLNNIHCRLNFKLCENKGNKSKIFCNISFTFVKGMKKYKRNECMASWITHNAIIYLKIRNLQTQHDTEMELTLNITELIQFLYFMSRIYV